MQGKIISIFKDPKLGLQTQTPLVVSRLEQYLQLLVKWNRKINLTSEKTAEDILYRHVFDSLQYSRVLEQDCRMMDIGSGAGFPGIPLKIIFPQINLVLVESQRKRCSFLEAVIRDLEMEKVEVINARVEEISVTRTGTFEAIVFRAVSSSQACLSLGERFLVPDGKIILKKSPEEKQDQSESNLMFLLDKEVSISSYHDVVSSLLVFSKCFT
ncbi:MAG: 16S rRNA (guanine(527)-N(7))-methyltransferase RsmG [Nitrospina sp.]|nr:16S rRNA (guanine(527)-N(7))-methyltransferase RsmG [Nitrospina sp.]